MRKRRNHDAGFKARVAREAVKGERTVSELAAEYRVHPTMIHQWKKALLDGAADIFERGGKKTAEIDEDTVRALHAKIGELAVANDFFVQKAQALDREVRRKMIERDHPALSVGAQCRLLSISRSSFYYEPQGETEMNLALMLLIDKQFLETPFYGVQQMTWHLQAKAGVGRWITFCNHQRPHPAHRGQPPAVVYFNSIETDKQAQAVA